MEQRIDSMRVAAVSAVVLALVLGGCGSASASDAVEEALLGLGAEPSERTCDNSENDSPLAQVIDSTSCWTIEIKSSIPDTTSDVVEALQESDVAGGVERESCTNAAGEAKAYLPCHIRLLPESGGDEVLVVDVGATLPESDDPDEWALQGTPGTFAEVIVGIGNHVEFSPGEWVNEEVGASIRLDRDGKGEVFSVPVSRDPVEGCGPDDSMRLDGEIEWALDRDELIVSVTSVNGDFTFELHGLEVAGGDWRLLQHFACSDGWMSLYRDDI